MSSETLNPQRETAETSEILLELVDNLDAMVAYWDANRTCVFANEAYRAWFGVSGRDVIGRTMKELLGPLYEMNLPFIEAAYAGDVQVFERDIPTPTGTVRSSLATYRPHVVDGRVEGIFVHVADVTPLKKLERELRAAKEEAEERATHDFLTGLPNRVLLEDRMLQALATAKRSGRRAAVVTVDLDDFKEINDTYGHAAGDRLLVEVATRLRRALRERDSATRMGGDEFLLLFPEVDSVSQVEVIARRIIEAISEPLRLGDAVVSIGCCLGIALSPRQAVPSRAAEPAALFAASDRALYRAKRRGRNHFEFGDP